MTNQELAHHGIKGMKWGVRKKQYNTSADHNRANELEKKHMSEMTNQELKEFTTRRELEDRYKKQHPDTFKKVIGAVATAAAALGTVALLYENGRKVIKGGSEVYKGCKNSKIGRVIKESRRL